jgi:hypothetical protein
MHWISVLKIVKLQTQQNALHAAANSKSIGNFILFCFFVEVLITVTPEFKKYVSDTHSYQTLEDIHDWALRQADLKDRHSIEYSVWITFTEMIRPMIAHEMLVHGIPERTIEEKQTILFAMCQKVVSGQEH